MGIAEVICILLILLLIAMALWARRSEVKRFNNGICIHCGDKLESFDMDSQGGTGWKCENSKCDHSLWTSWVKIKK